MVELYGEPGMIVWPAVKVQLTVQVWIVYGELFVTVIVAPKSGGLLEGVCHPIVKVALHAAPVSAGAGLAVSTVPEAVPTATSMAAMNEVRERQ
jgi:hypothetical protein